MPDKFDKDRIERAARIYHSNRDAAAALGILNTQCPSPEGAREPQWLGTKSYL